MRYQLLHTENGQIVREMSTMERPKIDNYLPNREKAYVIDMIDYNRHEANLKEYPVTDPPFPYDHLAALPAGVVGLQHQIFRITKGYWVECNLVTFKTTKHKTRIAAKYLPPQEKEEPLSASKCLNELVESIQGGLSHIYSKAGSTTPSVKVEGEESQEELWWEVFSDCQMRTSESFIKLEKSKFTIKRNHP